MHSREKNRKFKKETVCINLLGVFNNFPVIFNSYFFGAMIDEKNLNKTVFLFLEFINDKDRSQPNI